MNILVVANPKRSLKTLNIISQFFKQYPHIHIYYDEDSASALQLPSFKNIELEHISLICVVGGDGSLLYWSQQFGHLNIPFVGINTGSLGYMSEISLENIVSSLEKIAQGHYTLDERMAIEVFHPNGLKLRAINDAVLYRSSITSLIKLRIEVDGEFLGDFKADGVIVCTPNGSTAYSLSAGGSIFDSRLCVMGITLICAHMLTARPIIIDGKSQISITYLSDKDPAQLIIDGQKFSTVESEQKIIIERSPQNFTILNLSNTHFSAVREKLGWST